MVLLLLVFVVWLITAAAPAALTAQWHPADAPLMTRWAEEVSPENVWPEYPRPQMVREDWMSLNGLWDYAITPRTSPAPEDYEGSILVPFAVESALSGVGRRVTPDDRLWYRRQFAVPPAWIDRRLLLHFGALDWEMTLWVNGGLVGSHRGGYDPFYFDITDFLVPGQDHEVVVAVTDPTSLGDQPRGKQRLGDGRIWYTPVSGIWQTVWLEPVPAEASVGEIRITPRLEEGEVDVAVLGLYPHNSDAYAARVRVREREAGPVLAESTHRLDRLQTLRIPDPRPWSPDDPFLYDLDVELFRVPAPDLPPRTPRRGAQEQAYFGITEDTVLLDAVDSYFGMRSVSVEHGNDGFPRLALNGEVLFQYGPLDQGFWPGGLYTPPSEAAMLHDLTFIKSAGFNMLRKHIKVEPARYYYLADSLGLLIWQDMPAGMLANEPPFEGPASEQNVRQYDDAELLRRTESGLQFELELRRMVASLYNHPSIVMWVVHNEGWGQFGTKRLVDMVHGVDSTRLVLGASGWRDAGVGDVLSQHTYSVDLWDRERDGLKNILPDPDIRRPAVIGEFGGIALPIDGHVWAPEAVFGYQIYETPEELLEQYRHRVQQVLEARTTHGVSAAVYTQTTDIEKEVNGLMTYDREVIKIDPAVLRSLHGSLYR